LIIAGDTISYLDYSPSTHPIGFGATDTIFYNAVAIGDPGFFATSIRESLGLSSTDVVNTDAIDPSQLSLDMFSAEELFNNGGSYVTYFGYDHMGNKLKNQPAYEEFFTDTINRPIGAYRPIYTALWAYDKYTYKDITLNIGLRIDRFDANQKVLHDKYSLYPVRTVDEVTANHPSTIGDDYVVYVDDFTKPADQINIVGYRDGDTWYSAEGTEIVDPRPIAEQAVTGRATPYFQETDPTKLKLDINSFKDYEPQLAIMPRIGFSFQITDQAQFFGHYDVLTQRPRGSSGRTSSVVHTTQFEYFYFNTITNTTIISNPDLKPEKTIDYKMGFRQKVSKSSAIKIEGFYREIKDQVQVANLEFAYPISYRTYLNQDFGTVKGLTVAYDLRRTNNIRVLANYTLQFADGTGSSITSGLRLVGSGQANLRSIFPYNYDQRHTLTANIDYRFDKGKEYNGPKWFGKDIFEDAGVNTAFNLGSGTPYSKQDKATPRALFGVASRSNLDGSIHGSRKPWVFRMDLRVDKSFIVKYGGEELGPKKQIRFNVYLRVQNLLNTPNIIGVYRFTGNPSDDGYLASGEGQQAINASLNPVSYVSLYNVKVTNPNNFSIPRRIYFGASINF
ncbi:MAG: hypothetical protein IH946_00660, partial [Bacteroidetes bacterium]|nr:hypothetical protein [Bacteroidota bacterium]